MEPSVKIFDHRSLDELIEAQQYAGDSILKLVAHVGEYFDSMIKSMEDMKKELEKQVQEAQEELSQAESDYSSCLSSQTYDEEDGCYHPSCDAEASYVDHCREVYDDLKKRDEQAAQVLSDCKHELDAYRAPFGFIQPPGGETLMKYLGKEHTDAACDKMDKIRECVKKYLDVPCSIRDAKQQRNAEQIQLYEEASQKIKEKEEQEEQENRDKKIDAFRSATERLQHSQSREGFRSANAVAICPQCGRPINVCICQHIMERRR